jgi:hypothetical protein
VKCQLGFCRGIDSVQWFAGNEGGVPVPAGNDERLTIVLRRFNVLGTRRESHVLGYEGTGCLKIDGIRSLELCDDSRYRVRAKQRKQHKQPSKSKSHKTS